MSLIIYKDESGKILIKKGLIAGNLELYDSHGMKLDKLRTFEFINRKKVKEAIKKFDEKINEKFRKNNLKGGYN